ncbi:type II toxin-antitoxin system YafQ family toxin [Vagococcus fluvialis]|uniref:type II toxin-antitoxin system YafQ family toxin n=1 Tax=Vagococcus fluvialis TaxID=2738 RepID=UPI003B214C25
MKIERTATFKRNVKALIKKNYDIKKLETVLGLLINQETEILKNQYKDHALKGDLKSFRELHIEGDWLLVYQIKDNRLVLLLVATGSHDDVFRASKKYK